MKDMMDIRSLITEYIDAYNALDVERMIKHLHGDIEFRNITNGIVDTETTGIEQFRLLAEKSTQIFSQRKQTITQFNVDNDVVELEIDYEGTLAIDLPNGLKAGEVLRLKGKSIFKIIDGKIIMIEDYS